MKNKIYDVIFFVGGTAILLLGLFTTLDEYGFFSGESTEWHDILFIIVGISMIVFGFVRRSWNKRGNQ